MGRTELKAIKRAIAIKDAADATKNGRGCLEVALAALGGRLERAMFEITQKF